METNDARLIRAGSTVKLPKWNRGWTLITKNTKHYGGLEPTGVGWTWGDPVVTPFGDDISKPFQ